LSAALDLMYALVLEDGRRWGDAAVGWQRVDAEAVLEGPVPYSFLTRPRGGSKTDDLGGVAVCAMLTQLPPRSRCYGLAANREQGRLLVDSIQGFAARTPELRGALNVDAYKVTSTRTGSTLEVLPADESGSWGLRPGFCVIDELGQWGRDGFSEAVVGERHVGGGEGAGVAACGVDDAELSGALVETDLGVRQG
jgi:hypothetical protein